jgi:magnesium transporter
MTSLPPTPELLYLLAGDPAELAEMLTGLRSADIAEALKELTPEAASHVLAALPFDLAVQVLDEPELEHRALIIETLAPAAAAQLIDAMSADQQADVLREMPDRERTRLIKTLDPPTRESLKLLLQYPPESAGGIMTIEFVSIPSNWTVDESLRHIGDVGRAKETVYAVYIHEPTTHALVHVVSLRELITGDRTTNVLSVGDRRKPISVNPMADREEVARLISKYDLLAIPVVDDTSRVLGIVTVDDVIDAIVAEQTEDVQKLGGMAAIDEAYMEIGFRQMIRKRAGWLTALFIGEMLTTSAMQYFQDELASALVLMLFVPLIISSGGNSGSQATSLIIRALATRDVTIADWWRVARRELPTGLTLGLILGLVGVCRILIWHALDHNAYQPHPFLVALTVGIALVGVVATGSLTGSMLPFLLRRLGFDPASASAPFVATLVDVTGIVIYFTVAKLILLRVM